MSEIKITSPVTLEISLLETDEYIPSFKIEIKINDNELKGSLQIVRYVWIKNEDWDIFESSENGELKDMSDNPVIKIRKQEDINKNILSLYFSSSSPNGFQTIELNYFLNNEMKMNVYNKIKSFPKWW